ncbi:MAG TPA: tetratricopeptide repeat protein [Solirubrobacterales bacterium]|nr:tetratricopeptide repeat protein [Solirubrobacterales bacterium]
MRIRNRKTDQDLVATIECGRRLLVSERHQETLKFLEKAIQVFPEDAEVRLLYATVLLDLRPADVAAEASKAVELGPDDPVILVRAGGLLLNRGQLDAARSCFKQARETVGPDFLLMPGLLNREGLLAIQDRDFDLAEEKLSAAVESEPTSEPFANDLARLLASRGRLTEAVEVVDQALQQVKKKGDLERLRTKLEAAILSERD